MRSFLVIFYGNTGSSWLTDAITSDPDVFVPGFEPLERWVWPVTDAERLDWMRTVFTPPDDRSGAAYEAWLEELGKNPQFQKPRDPNFTYVGFKMNANVIEDRTAFLKLLLDAESKIVLLERRNRIKHALSIYRHHEEGKSQFEEAGVRPPSVLDLEKFHARVEESVENHAQSQVFWEEALAMLGPDAITRVQYEDFIDGPGKVATMKRLSAFLGTVDYEGVASMFKKATPDDLATAVINFDELVSKYAETEFEDFFGETRMHRLRRFLRFRLRRSRATDQSTVP